MLKHHVCYKPRAKKMTLALPHFIAAYHALCGAVNINCIIKQYCNITPKIRLANINIRLAVLV